MSDGYKVVLKEDSGIQMTPEIQDWLDMVNKELNKPETEEKIMQILKESLLNKALYDK